MPKYSFVLPAYKVRFFKEALDSILAQTYREFELIIVNDASPEDLDSIVKGYNDPRIRYYVNEENIGGKDLVAQWNHCLEYASGEYVILASDDDIYHPEYLEKMDELVEKYPEVNVFRSRIVLINANGDIISIDGYLNEYSSVYEYFYFMTRGVISSGIPEFIFKSEPLKINGGFINFPSAWFSDDATVLYTGKDGIVTSKEILFKFRQSKINISSAKNSESAFLKQIDASKHFLIWMQEFTAKWNNISDIYAYMTYNSFKNYIIGKVGYTLSNTPINIILRHRKKILDIGCISSKMLYKQIVRMVFVRLQQFVLL